MKKILLSFFVALAGFAAHAQETTLAPDQNPRYAESRDRYIKAQDQLLVNMNTTVQQTYKAYDWYEAKQERKLQRYNDRRERRLLRAQYGNFYSPYDNNYYSPYRYAPGFRRNGWRRGW
ncbi:hypothetical protein [Ferruginibacter sp. HRS2-29]|uniref:hypothetical protein n=1 Tax=Ferruginibacter sp. HRS2-29 TaxID=2487334 RepID=UPI0020CCAB34|nr:hypothetical protein [Ferruginibacter sp. HRS2-29]MCP9752576.1 hypothetical protein [Ferruginibacter sp. HRS2-29]